MLKKNKKENVAESAKEKTAAMLHNLKRIYSNKSSDEYKCKGDITKSPSYNEIEFQLANLSSIKKYPEADIEALKNMFNVLHRPIFSKMVMEYINKPDERNIVFTTCFTVGYRLLVGELARVHAATESTDKGFVYKPDKASRKESVMLLIKKYKTCIEKSIDDMIKKENASSFKQEAALLGAVGDIANLAVGMVEGVFGVLNNIFKSAASLNPISLMSAVLTRSYDKKVEKFEKVAKEYELAKKAYDDYKKQPASKRKERIEHRYVKMIDKYNIKMEKLKAEIDHYDMRAMEEADEDAAEVKKTSGSKNPTAPKNDDNGGSDNADDSNDGFDF